MANTCIKKGPHPMGQKVCFAAAHASVAKQVLVAAVGTRGSFNCGCPRPAFIPLWFLRRLPVRGPCDPSIWPMGLSAYAGLLSHLWL